MIDEEVMGRKLVMLRGSKTQEQVAKDLGISQSALASYETGQRVPRDEIKVKLAKYYNRSVGFLFFNLKDHEV